MIFKLITTDRKLLWCTVQLCLINEEFLSVILHIGLLSACYICVPLQFQAELCPYVGIISQRTAHQSLTGFIVIRNWLLSLL